MGDKILNLELSQEDESLLRESLTTWKEGQYAELLEEVEELKRQTIEELEEANAEYKEELKIGKLSWKFIFRRTSNIERRK